MNILKLIYIFLPIFFLINAEEQQRLPTALKPIAYDLTIKVNVPGFIELSDAEKETFTANLTIEFHAFKPTKIIELNALKLNFKDDLNVYKINQISNNKEVNFLI